MENRHSTLISLAGLLGLTLAMFGDVLFAGGTRVLGAQATDLSLPFLSWRDFGFCELAKGNLALWNPHIYGGAPYFGSMLFSAIQATRETFTPSWRAIALPGSAQANYQLLPANYVLRAVPLAAGHHRLRVEYASQAFEIGRWISIVTGLPFLAALSWCWRDKSS